MRYHRKMMSVKMMSSRQRIGSKIQKSNYFVFVGLLAILLNVSSVLEEVAVAEVDRTSRNSPIIVASETDWVRELFRAFAPAAADGLVQLFMQQINVPQVPFDAAMSEYIAGRKVDFYGSKDGREYWGAVVSSWRQANLDTSKSGAAAAVDWNDGVKSSILFIRNRRVRIWNYGKEYGGKWIVKNNILYVSTDDGAYYRFRP
jgi:hypothetical protein